MKKGVYFALLLLLSLSVQGCAGQQKETETQAETQAQAETEPETRQAEETESETETETAAVEKAYDLQVSTIIGSLVDIDLEQITVLSDNGNEIILPIKEAELDFTSGFRVGNLISVDYTGKIQETDNLKADITVLRAADSSDVQELEISPPRKETEADTEEGTEQESESAALDSEEPETQSGTSDSGKPETQSEEEETGAESSEASEESAETESAAEEVLTIRGEIQNLDRNSMTILEDDKQELTFGIMNVRMYFARGMKKGTEVVVSYTGELSGEEQEVISVMDAVSFKEKENE